MSCSKATNNKKHTTDIILSDYSSCWGITGPQLQYFSALFASCCKSPALCWLTPGSVSVSRLCCPKAVWVPVRKRRAKAAPIQTSFPEPLKQQLHHGAMSNPSAPNQITDAVASVIHSVSAHDRIQKILSLPSQVELQRSRPHDETREAELVTLVTNQVECYSGGDDSHNVQFMVCLVGDCSCFSPDMPLLQFILSMCSI